MRERALIICHDNPIDPLGAMQLAGAVPGRVDIGFATPLADVYAPRPLTDYKVVGFSTLTGTHRLHSHIAVRMKQDYPHIRTIMGGPHPTFFPQSAAALPGIDLICIGEGVTAFRRLLEDKWSPNILNEIGFYALPPDNLLPLVNADDLLAARHPVYSHPNRRHNSIRNFMGTFGCPFNCTYCFNDSFAKLYPYQSRVRYKTPRLFVGEMSRCVATWGAKLLYIQDDTFMISRGWFTEVVERIYKDVGLPYHCHIRCDMMTEKTVQKLSQTGCHSVTFAIEDASEGYREEMLGRKMSDDQILRTARWLHHYGIRSRIENMVGLPGNQLKENLATMRLNARCRPTIGWAGLFQPYPSTKLGELTRQMGLWGGNIDTINSSFFDTSPLRLPQKKAVERLQKIFSLCVDSWWWRLLAPILVRLPLDGLYRRLYQQFKDKKYRLLYSRESNGTHK